MGRDEAKPARQTWREWVPGAPEHELLNRAELLAAAERLGLFAGQRNPPSTLRHWADEGLIPAPVIEGEEGTQRALYPRWVLDLISLLRRYQDDARGMEPDARRAHRATLAPRLRAAARQLARIDRDPLPADLLAEERDPFERWISATPLWEKYRHFILRPLHLQEPLGPPFTSWEAPSWIAHDVRRLVAFFRKEGIFDATEAMIRLVDADGLEVALPVPLAEDGRSDTALSAAPLPPAVDRGEMPHPD